jgi:nicotinamidase/pyrazinamidase
VKGDVGAALLIVDVQNDFCTGGSLAVPGSERVVTALNRVIDTALARGLPIYASRDWHPAVTRHFAQYGGRWPVHCVQASEGARFQPDLRLPVSAIVISKGAGPDEDGYSAFDGLTANGRTFADDLKARGINHLYVGGLATDYCVKHSVLDALSAGLRVTLLEPAIAGVDLVAGDSARALNDVRRQGAEVAADFPSH